MSKSDSTAPPSANKPAKPNKPYPEFRVWDVPKRELLKTLKGRDGLVRSLALSPDDKWLVTAGRDGNRFVWDFAAEKVVAAMDGGDGQHRP